MDIPSFCEEDRRFSEEATLHEEWFAETFCFRCGFLDVADWRLARIFQFLVEGGCGFKQFLNSFDEFVFLPGLQSVLVVNYNSIYNNGFIAISAGVFATVMYLFCIGAIAYLQMSVFFHISFMMVSCNGPQKGV